MHQKVTTFVLLATAWIVAACSHHFSSVKTKPANKAAATKKVPKPTAAEVKTIRPSRHFVPTQKVAQPAELKNYCLKMEKKFKKYGWKPSYCGRYQWHHVRNSVNGNPLVWAVYGDEKKLKENAFDTTLVLCGVHGDEITPTRFCYDILKHLEVNKELYKDKVIAVAPLANPDSFFRKKVSRVNANGVDINRNFPTKDWHARAIKWWKHRYKKDPRRNPGQRPMSEPEVVFQVNLIKRYRPSKIISVHAPLTMLDYDGPDKKHSDGHAKLANQLLISMSQKAAGYRVKNFPYFPGSLGNYAGHERKIPTYTLELPTSDPRYSDHYWQLFKNAIHHAFIKDLSGNSGKFATSHAHP